MARKAQGTSGVKGAEPMDPAAARRALLRLARDIARGMARHTGLLDERELRIVFRGRADTDPRVGDALRVAGWHWWPEVLGNDPAWAEREPGVWAYSERAGCNALRTRDVHARSSERGRV